MASVGEQIRTVLVGTPEIAALVSGRVFPNVIPQANDPRSRVQMPALRYTVVDDVPVNSVSGFTSGLRGARVQVDAFAKRYLDAQALADLVAGALGSESGPGILLSRRDGYEDETELHRVSMDFSMWTGG